MGRRVTFAVGETVLLLLSIYCRLSWLLHLLLALGVPALPSVSCLRESAGRLAEDDLILLAAQSARSRTHQLPPRLCAVFLGG